MSAEGLRTALVIQGGGTRAITSCAAAGALQHLGLTDAFDCIYAVSAGALNAAYFLAGRAALGLSVYLEDISSTRFISMRRWPRIMDLDYLFEEVISKSKRIDLTRVTGHSTPLQVLTTEVTTGAAVWFSSHATESPFLKVLQASCALPIASRPVEIDGRRLMDGMLSEPIPIMTALEDAYTDILLLHTRDHGYRVRTSPTLQSMIERSLAKILLPSRTYVLFRREPVLFNRLAGAIESGWLRNERGHVTRIAVAHPTGVREMSRFERDKTRLELAAYSSWKAVMEMFGSDLSRDAFEGFIGTGREVVQSIHNQQ